MLGSFARVALLVIACGFGAGGAAAGTPAEALQTAAHPAREFPFKRTSAEYETLRHMGQGHPNELARMDALEAYADGRMRAARDRFESAARYGDKFSQYRLSLMFWYGDDAQPDPVLAYVWADLAAERGYREMLAVREEIWGRLDERQQRRAAEIGREYYAKYGDAAAKPRLNRELIRGKREITGSHAGFDAGVKVIFPGSGVDFGQAMAFGNGVGNYYADYRWDPEKYWHVEDAVLGGGEVTVGAPQPVEDRK